ncbi:UNVERIFIED_CONTAM: hypothetical protein Scaly_0170300 [Sesamum calycinum]|uniref:Uncharacterized protein n=2 Tax=Sesamum TaxID=4181 RepID=A0AAW2SYM0_9LAMI
MEEEPAKFKVALSFKRRIDPTLSGGNSENDLPTYTSLKDIIMNNSSPKHTSNTELGIPFDSANISIRNELVKHAASAYVLSAVNPANRDQDWISAFWEKMKASCIGFESCCHVYVSVPLQALCRPVVRVFYQVVRRIRNGLMGKVETS